MYKFLSTLLVFFFFLSNPGLAGIIECVQPDGTIVYTDKPCEDGKGKVIKKFEDKQGDFFAEGTFKRNGKTFTIKTGHAYWVKTNQELSIILLPEESPEQLIKEVRDIHLHAFADETSPFYAHITLNLNPGMMGLSSVSYMRTVLLGMEERRKTDWAITFPDLRLYGKLKNFKIFRAPENNQVKFSSDFTNEDISWNYEIKLPIEEQQFR